MFPACNQQGLKIKLGNQVLTTLHQCIVIRAVADHGLELGQIGGDLGRATVAGEIHPLGVDQDLSASRACNPDEARHVLQGPFSIV
jgi:hypothetical protein